MTDDAFDVNEAKAACEQLASALVNPAHGVNTLRRQADLLDTLLYNILTIFAGKIEQGDGNAGREWFELGLRIQKQCADTIKTAAAIEYMQSLAPRPPLPLPRHSLNSNDAHQEQSEERRTPVS